MLQAYVLRDVPSTPLSLKHSSPVSHTIGWQQEDFAMDAMTVD